MRRPRDRSASLAAGALMAFCAGALGAATPPSPAATPSRTPAPAAAAPTPKGTVAGVVRLAPKARVNSTYSLAARFDIANRDISFEAPDAYKQGFDFWAGRMKGQKRSEVYEITTVTQDADKSGQVPFRRTIPKFDLEFERQGEMYAASDKIEKDLRTYIWEGTLDPSGNQSEKRKVSGKDNPEIDGLQIAEIDRIFPSVQGVKEIRIGEGFKDERVVPLPTKLNIAGLEDVTLTLTRTYTLKAIANGLATFDVKTSYSNDPAFKAKAENATCTISTGSGNGAGEAVFEVERGVFVSTRMASSMRIDIEAPLRPLPGHPETDKPGLGKSHIDLDLVFFASQTVKRLWGDDKS